jgi:hypothetical protein
MQYTEARNGASMRVISSAARIEQYCRRAAVVFLGVSGEIAQSILPAGDPLLR